MVSQDRERSVQYIVGEVPHPGNSWQSVKQQVHSWETGGKHTLHFEGQREDIVQQRGVYEAMSAGTYPSRQAYLKFVGSLKPADMVKHSRDVGATSYVPPTQYA